MATWQLVEYVSRTMVKLVETHLALVLPGNTIDVRIATPHSFGDLKSVTTPTISIFLYRVNEQTELRNTPQRRMPDGTTRRQPLALELYYMVTTWGARGNDPMANDFAAAVEEHQLLGAVLQGFYDHAEVSRAELFEDPSRPLVWGATDALQIVLETLPIEDLYRIWDAGELHYQLSATYRVRVLGLESSEVLGSAPVVDAGFDFARKIG